MSQPQTLQQLQQRPAHDQSPVSMSFFDLQGFELMQRIAKAFSSSSLVPKQYQSNLPNCMIALDMARRIGANPLMVMQNLYIVHGTPGWSSKFLIATVNTCGRYSTLRYEWVGTKGKDDYGCRAWAIEKETGERLDGIVVDWAMVKAEGWSSKSGSKWLSMADQMFIYRAAAFWQRAYAPDLGMGLISEEEIRDTYDAQRGSDGSYSVELSDLQPQASEVIESDASEDDLALDHQPGEQVDLVSGEITQRQADPEPTQSRATSEKPKARQAQQQIDDDDLAMD